jgi:hypothetical protein
MPRAKRVCSHPGCPNPATGTRCTQHEREHDRARGTKTQRGYGADYQRQRRAWALKIKAGGVTCWRCGQAMHPDAPFDLGHDDDDRSIIRGPECPTCNRSAAGKASHRYT